MKNYPLSLQIWIVIAIITLLISGILVFILPHTLRDFFTAEVYSTIRTAQEYFNSSPLFNTEKDDSFPEFYLDKGFLNEDAKTVKHFIVYSDGSVNNNLVFDSNIPLGLIHKSQREAIKQTTNTSEYVLDIGGNKIFYIITKASLETNVGPLKSSENISLVSFLSDSYREDLVQTLFKKLAGLTIIILIASWVPAMFFSRYLSNPLVSLEKKVVKLTDRHWEEEIKLDRKDEIGKLGDSVEKLRKELIRQDQAEQAFLQNISHELKTPIMVIKSYSQAISDGIFPEGDLQSSLNIIDEETDRLENRVQSLLYITKLDYMANFEQNSEEFLYNPIIYSTVKKLNLRNPNIKWTIDLPDILIYGNLDQMQIVTENILDNALRYASSAISITASKLDGGFRIRFWNDGSQLNEDSINTIFEKFHKGKDGEIGLGLAIVKRIIEIHKFHIFAKNEDNGVSFYIDIK